MKINCKPNILPYFTLGAGGLGLCLQIWLLGTRDEQGLLATGHAAGILSFLLFALTALMLCLCTRRLAPVAKYSQLFPASLWGALGCAAGAAAILSGLFEKSNGLTGLFVIRTVIGIAAAACLVFIGYCRFKGRHPSFLFHCVITVYFMLHLVSHCRVWGAQPQLQLSFFPFLGSIFLLLSTYQRAVLDAGKGQRQWYVLWNQAAVFCCLLAAAGSDKLFYLAMAAWQLTNLCALQTRRQPSKPHQEEA